MDDLIIRNPNACSNSSICGLLSCFYWSFRRRTTPFWFQIFYFLFLSALGYLVLITLNHRTDFTPRHLDFFFTSVSSATVSSMSTVEMEVFSNPQLIVITILMFVGGEVFTSMVGLFIRRYELNALQSTELRVASASSETDFISRKIELGLIKTETPADPESLEFFHPSHDLMYSSIKLLGFIVLGYLLVVNVLGTSLIWIYVSVVSSAKDVLRNKGINSFTFSIFTTVSTFASCGFVPTNENMIVFKKNSVMLLLLIPQILLGNTLFPSSLRFCIWFFGKFIRKSNDSKFLLKNTKEIDYLHLLPNRHSKYLVGTVFGFIFVQFVLFCSMEWHAEGLNGMNHIEKIVGVLFECVNSRHTGETIVDLSKIAPAILTVFVIMMYLPPYTSFLPSYKLKHGKQEDDQKMRKKRSPKIVENLILSQLSYLALFVVLICITERKKMKEDPLNFNVLNIVIEVISAYGNVGFSMGYSCARQLNPDGNCVDKSFGFSGKWSDGGKVLLIFVMFFGRLKKFNMNGGKAWIIM